METEYNWDDSTDVKAYSCFFDEEKAEKLSAFMNENSRERKYYHVCESEIE